MVSLDLIRGNPFFADLSTEQITILAQTAEEVMVEAEQYFFHEGDELDCFYIVIEGQVGILVDVPDPAVSQPVSRQLTGNLITKEVVVATVEPGEMFAWSALVPPHQATSSAKTLTPCRVIAFDCRELRTSFEENYALGYLMMLKATLIIRERLRAMRVESISDILAEKGEQKEPTLQAIVR